MDAFPILGEMLEESVRGEKDHLWKGVSGKVWVDRAALARIRKVHMYAPKTPAELQALVHQCPLLTPLPLDFGATSTTPFPTPNPTPQFECSLSEDFDQIRAITPIENSL